MENEDVNKDGPSDQQPPNGQGSSPEARPHEAGNAAKERWDAQAQVRADASGGQSAQDEVAPLSDNEAVTREEFEEYVHGEINEIGAKLGYRRIQLELAPSNELWPAWYYPKGSTDGKVCQDESEVPEGWVRRPFE